MTHPPITPPQELFKQWEDDILAERDNVDHVLDCAWKDGFRAGADQELEACLDEIYRGVGLRIIDHGSHRELLCSDLRAARRPKPPSLKAQAFAALKNSPVDPVDETLQLSADAELIIRRALEALDD